MKLVENGAIVFFVDMDDIADEDTFFEKLTKIDRFKELDGPHVNGIYAITIQISEISEIAILQNKITQIVEEVKP